MAALSGFDVVEVLGFGAANAAGLLAGARKKQYELDCIKSRRAGSL